MHMAMIWSVQSYKKSAIWVKNEFYKFLAYTYCEQYHHYYFNTLYGSDWPKIQNGKTSTHRLGLANLRGSCDMSVTYFSPPLRRRNAGVNSGLSCLASGNVAQRLSSTGIGTVCCTHSASALSFRPTSNPLNKTYHILHLYFHKYQTFKSKKVAKYSNAVAWNKLRYFSENL